MDAYGSLVDGEASLSGSQKLIGGIRDTDGVGQAPENSVYRVSLLSVVKYGSEPFVIKHGEMRSKNSLEWEVDEDGDDVHVIDLVLDCNLQFYSISKTMKFHCFWVHKPDGLYISLWRPVYLRVCCDHVRVVPGSIVLGDRQHHYELTGSPERPFEGLLNGGFQNHLWGLHGAATIVLGYDDKEWEEAYMPLIWKLDFNFNVDEIGHPVLQIQWESMRV